MTFLQGYADAWAVREMPDEAGPAYRRGFDEGAVGLRANLSRRRRSYTHQRTPSAATLAVRHQGQGGRR